MGGGTRNRLVGGLLALLSAAVCLGCTAGGTVPQAALPTDEPTSTEQPEADRAPKGRVTLAFVGDMHFQLQLTALLQRPRWALGPVAAELRDADVTMGNLESAITQRGTLEAKELEVPSQRYWFRTSSVALDVLARAGIDVVTMANNHAADYGPVGLADSLRAARRGPVGVIGIGEDRKAALAPYRVEVRGTKIAFLAADSSPREGSSSVWSAGRSTPGVADARSARPRALLAAVRAADRRDDVVVVYLHWGTDGRRCPDPRQRSLASVLARAGADVVVGTHTHVLQGSGWIGDTYVSYGLGNFLWYHNHQPDDRRALGGDPGRRGRRRRVGARTHQHLRTAVPAGRSGARPRRARVGRAPRVHRPRVGAGLLSSLGVSAQPPAAEKCW